MTRSAFSQLLERSIVRYLITGAIGFAVEVGVIWLFVYGLGTGAVLAVAVSFWIGLLASFLMQKLFTFRNVEKNAKSLSRQTVLFAALVGVNYLFTLIFVALVEPAWQMPTVTRACALIVTTGWNYFAYKYIIFRAPRAK